MPSGIKGKDYTSNTEGFEKITICGGITIGKRPSIKTTVKEAIDYWCMHIKECDLSVDWSEADTHCWRCGCEKNLQRCHIIPYPLGGKDVPSNIVLLCSRCHAEGPNVTDSEIMWDWIRAYKVTFYGTFWVLMGMREYKHMYRKSFSSEINDILECAGVHRSHIDELIKENMRIIGNEASNHFGQPYFNASTIAGLYRMMLKRITKELGISFPIENSRESRLVAPWWDKV